MVPFLVILCSALLLAGGGGGVAAAGPQWEYFDVKAHAEFLIPDSTDTSPSRYSFLGCAFHPPDEPVFSNSGASAEDKRKRKIEVVRKAESLVRNLDSKYAVPGGAAQSGGTAVGFVLADCSAEHGPAVVNVAEKLERILSEFKDYKYSHTSFTVKQTKDNKIDYFPLLVKKMMVCYSPASTDRLGGRLACLRELESLMTVYTLFFPKELPGFPMAVTHPLSLILTSLYPAVVADMLAAMQLDGVDPAAHAGEARRCAEKMADMASYLRRPGLHAVLNSVLPQPFANNPHSKNLLTKVGALEACVKEYAARGDPTRTTLRYIHRSPFADANKELFMNNPTFKHKDQRNLIKTFNKVMTRKREGWAEATVAIDLAANGKCAVRGEHYCGYVTRGGAECPRSSRSRSARPADCKYRCSGVDVRDATRRVTQALVERYYAQAAQWVLDELVAPTKQVEETIMEARKRLENAAATAAPQVAEWDEDDDDEWDD